MKKLGLMIVAILLVLPSLSFAQTSWADLGYAKARQLNISNIAKDVPDYVVLFYLDNTFDYVNTTNNLSDIRFYDKENETELKYWREFVNTTGYSYIYVQIPNLTNATNGGTEHIYMYYDNPAASTNEDSSIFNIYESCTDTNDWANGTNVFINPIANDTYFIPSPRGENYACKFSKYTVGFSAAVRSYNESAEDLGMSFWTRTWELTDGGTFGISNGSFIYTGITASLGGGAQMKTATAPAEKFRNNVDVADTRFFMSVFYMNTTSNYLNAEVNITTDSRANAASYTDLVPANVAGSGYPITELHYEPQTTSNDGIIYFDEIKTFPASQSIPVFALGTSEDAPVDAILPEITVLFSPSGTIGTDTVYINVTVTDDISVDTVTLEFDGVNESMTPVGSDVYTTMKSSLTETTHTYKIFANDTSNNINYTAEYYFTVDISAPVVSIQSPSGNYTASTLPLNFTVTDDNLDTNSCYYRLDIGSLTQLPSCDNNTLVNVSDGSHTLYVQATDTLNNTSNSTSLFSVDTSAPSVVIDAPSDASTVYIASEGVNVSLNTTITDGVQLDESTCTYQVDSNASVPFDCASANLNLTLGSHTVLVFAQDYAGFNDTDTVTFTVDITPLVEGTSSTLLLLIVTLAGIGLMLSGSYVILRQEELNSSTIITAGITIILGIALLSIIASYVALVT